MAKPRSFLSSTCYDLVDARAAINTFLTELGHEVLASENSTFGVTPGKHSHVACIDQVDNADFLILVVGGRRGGTHIGSEKSITNEEYRRALKRNIPVFIFVKKDVEAACRLYKKNPTGDFSAFVDDKRVFDFIDNIRGRSEDNWIRTFDDVNGIIDGLRAQFAYLHLLFSKRHAEDRQPKSKQAAKAVAASPFPGDFSTLAPDTSDDDERTSLIAGLKTVHGIIKAIRESGVTGIDEKLKVLWLLGRYGKYREDRLRMPEPQFKQRAWSTHRGDRVFAQLKEFGAWGSYEEDHDNVDRRGDMVVDLGLRGGGETAWAMKQYVADLVERFGDDEGLELFQKADMRFYAAEGARTPRPKVVIEAVLARAKGKATSPMGAPKTSAPDPRRPKRPSKK